MMHRVLVFYDALRGEPRNMPEYKARVLAEQELRGVMPGLTADKAAEMLADALATRAAERAKRCVLCGSPNQTPHASCPDCIGAGKLD